jgi:hypothetical protein
MDELDGLDQFVACIDIELLCWLAKDSREDG